MAPFLNLAKRIARKSSHNSFFHSAILIKGSNILSMAPNRGTKHAEIGCLDKVWSSETKNCIILSIRITKGGLLANAKPCPNCEQALRLAGVKKILYSTANRQIEEMRLN